MSASVRVLRGMAYAWLIVGIPFAVFEGLYVLPKTTMITLNAILGWVIVGWNLATRMALNPTLAIEAGAALAIIVVLLHLVLLTLHRGARGSSPGNGVGARR